MGINVGQIIQFTDVQTLLGQAVLNVYFYKVISKEILVDYNDLQGAFKVQVMDVIREMQADSLQHTRLGLKNLSNGIDIHEEPYALNGLVAGDPMPSTNVASFRLVRTSALTRHGSKRIGGLTDTMASGNTLDAGTLLLANDIAAALAAPIAATGTVDHDFELAPVIVGRFPEGDPNAGELDLSKINPVASAQYIRLSTQTTRRAGRGI